ncbi:Fanconi anemia group F protein [Pelodytes ibericus]
MPGKLTIILENLDNYLNVLAVSRTVHVRDWDILSVRRGLDWGIYFKHVYQRFQSSHSIRKILEDRLRLQNGRLDGSMADYQYVLFQHLGQSEALLLRNLLQNKALPKGVFKYLLSLLSNGGSQEVELDCAHTIVSQRAALQLLLPLPPSPSDSLQNPLDNPMVVTQAELLWNFLEDKVKGLERSQRFTCVMDILRDVPQPLVYRILAAALLRFEDSCTLESEVTLTQHLLEWLLVSSSTWSGFCRSLNCWVLTKLSCKYRRVREAYLDFLTQWASGMKIDIPSRKWASTSTELTFEALLDHFRCLMEGPEDLREATESVLKTLKARDGGFDVSGISIWTDLLLKLNKT